MLRSDGVFLEEFKYQAHEDILYRRLSQPSRGFILERNARLRADPSGIRKLDWGRPALTIPLEDLMHLKLKFPDLNSRDAEIRTRAWKKFLASGESRPYRIGTKV